MKRTLLSLVLLSVMISGCGSVSIKEIEENPQDFMGKEVRIKGMSSNSLRLGAISAFILEQENGSKITVSSEILPEDGSRVSVKGTVIEDDMFGTHILAKKVK